MKRFVLAAVAQMLVGLCLASAAFAEYGITSLSASLGSSQAGEHTDFTLSFLLNEDESGAAFAPTKNLEFEIPPGIVGNPNAFPTCTTRQLVESASLGNLFLNKESCPIDSQVGFSEVTISEGGSAFDLREPVYNMESPGGDVVARFGLVAEVIPTFIDVRLDPESGYGLRASARGLSSIKTVVAAKTTLWADPTDPAHDKLRVTPYEASRCNGSPCTAPGGEPRQSSLAPTPFMSNPTRCGEIGTVTMEAVSYPEPDQVATLSSPLLPEINGCGLLDFRPQIDLQPTVSQADSPAGIVAELTLPQEGLEHPHLLAEAHLKRVVTTLPEGLTLNPSAAAGLAACSQAQIGIFSEDPIRFNDADPTCPEASKVGSAEVDTPILPKPLHGSLYVARQDDNPFDALLSGYLVAKGQGVTLKLAGRFDVSESGRITAVFDENPQQPFDKVTLRFNSGPRGILVTPPSCGTYGIGTVFSPWSAIDPENPTAAETVPDSNNFEIQSGPGGAACPSGQFEPRLEAGTVNPVAGSYSPLTLRLHRRDGTQRISRFDVSPPLGLLGKLAGIPYCPEGRIAAATALSQPGQGAVEVANPSCPAASRLGSVIAGSGAGPSPIFVDTGSAFLAGPYKGAPVSMVTIAPAVAGPFDLGNVVVRTGFHVNSSTSRITAVSDPFPSALHGIALNLRDVRVFLDRPNFILNPTSCKEQSFVGSALSEQGIRASLVERFQVAGCSDLGFKPKLAVRLLGQAGRLGHPGLRAVYRGRPGDANLAKAVVRLPSTALLDQGHIRTVCTRVQFAAGSCPSASVYGHARAFSSLLDAPLEGPVYLRSSNNLLPDLVADLGGQIDIELVGRIDSVRGGIRTSFESTPDAPVEKFILRMQGGSKGLIINSRDLCESPSRATAKFTAHNDLVQKLRPIVQASCSAKSAAKKSHP